MRMKLYCTKFGKLVEAHPFSGGELIQLANWIDDLKCDVKTSAVFDGGLPTLILTKGDDVVTLKPHQWLVREDENEFRVVSAEQFPKLYTLHNPSEGE